MNYRRSLWRSLWRSFGTASTIAMLALVSWAILGIIAYMTTDVVIGLWNLHAP